MTFDEYVGHRTPQQERHYQMLQLIPKFQIGKSNGRTVAEMCQWLSENSEHFRNMTAVQVERLYYLVKPKFKAAHQDQGVKPAIEAEAVAKNPERAVTPLVATAPVAPPAVNTGPQSQTAEDPALQKSQESGMEQWRAAQAARAEAIKKLEALGDEAGEWVASTYPDLSKLKEDAAWTEWLDAEPGRRQMVDELVRTAFRGGQNPEVADRPLSDFMLRKFSGSTDMSLSKRIHKAKVLATRRVRAA